MRITYSLAAIARAVWNNTYVPLASRIVYSVDQPVTAGTVSDKTGYTLTAGSYTSVKSKQAGTITITSGGTTGSASISNITEGKTLSNLTGYTNSSGLGDTGVAITVGSTSMSAVQGNSSGVNTTVYFEAWEEF